jgi:hypothetical protein
MDGIGILFCMCVCVSANTFAGFEKESYVYAPSSLIYTTCSRPDIAEILLKVSTNKSINE